MTSLHRPRLLQALCAMAMCCATLACGTAGAETALRELRVCADPDNLPFSNAKQEGFENRIAALIAEDLHAQLHFEWLIQRRGFLRRTLHAGICDVVMGASAGLPGLSVTRPYYTSAYAFVTLRGSGHEPKGFDDPVLSDLKIGLHVVGFEGANTPPASALAHRGIVNNIVGFPMWSDSETDMPQTGRIVDAVASGEIDTAIIWGPFAGFFAARYPDKLRVSTIASDPELPALPFTFSIAVGVRKEDEKLKALLQDVLDRKQPQIQAILNDYQIPQVEQVSSGRAPGDRRARAEVSEIQFQIKKEH